MHGRKTYRRRAAVAAPETGTRAQEKHAPVDVEYSKHKLVLPAANAAVPRVHRPIAATAHIRRGHRCILSSSLTSIPLITDAQRRTRTLPSSCGATEVVRHDPGQPPTGIHLAQARPAPRCGLCPPQRRPLPPPYGLAHACALCDARGTGRHAGRRGRAEAEEVSDGDRGRGRGVWECDDAQAVANCRTAFEACRRAYEEERQGCSAGK